MRSRRTLPEVGRIEPTSILPSVVLPEPELPMMASDSPFFSEKEMPFRITFFCGGGTKRMRSTSRRPSGLGRRRRGKLSGEVMRSCLIRL
ncbi:hypothetical protein D3C78_1493450 [compost metagenome]